METCCVPGTSAPDPARCPACNKPGRPVERVTVKALLQPEALARISAPEHRFCATPGCPVVYFGGGEVFGREEVRVPVFHKEPEGDRLLCYCFGIREDQVRREIEASGRSASAARIKDLVKAVRCACEVRNPEGAASPQAHPGWTAWATRMPRIARAPRSHRASHHATSRFYAAPPPAAVTSLWTSLAFQIS